MICLSLCTRLHSQRLGVVGPVGPPGEVRQVKLNLVPAVVQPHRHGADERLHSSCALIVTRPKPSPNVFIVQHLGDVNKCKQIVIIKPSMSTRQRSVNPYLDFKCEVLLKVLDDHDQKWKSNAEGLLGVCRTCYIGGAAEKRESIKK